MNMKHGLYLFIPELISNDPLLRQPWQCHSAAVPILFMYRAAERRTR